MKSVGEVMAIGCTFQESLQKALRGLEIGMLGFDPILDTKDAEWRSVLKRELASPSTCDCGTWLTHSGLALAWKIFLI